MNSNICLYCGGKSETRDHIPTRGLLNKPYPNNLMTVPSCKKCNNSFSKDEEYLIILLITISDSHTLSEKQESNGKLDRAIDRKPLLYDSLIDTLTIGGNGKVFINIEQERVGRIVSKIACGIYSKEFKQVRPLVEFNRVKTFSIDNHSEITNKLLSILQSEHFASNKWTVVQKDVFSYTIIRNYKVSQLLIFMNLHNTLLSCIEMPIPYSDNK